MTAANIAVLLLENDESHAEAIRRALQSSDAHFKAVVACSLREYRDCVAAGSPDIALLNMVMPDGRSLDLVLSPSEANAFPIVVMASLGDDKTIVEAMKAGALDYVVKSPQAFAVMPRILCRALDRWRLIQERKQAEESRRLSEQKYRQLIENVNDVVFSLDAAGCITYISPVVHRLFGYKDSDMTGKHSSLFIPVDDRPMLEQELARLKDEPGLSLEFRGLDSSGNLRYLSVSVQPVMDQGRLKSISGMLSDITVRRRLEEERQRVEKLESIGLLAGGIAHDFNNILTAIMGNISLAAMDVEPGSEIHESLGKAEKAALRAKDLTQQLLSFAKGGAPVKTLASVPELLQDTAGFALRGSNVKCRFSIPPDLWHAEIDEGQVSQIIHNLVINAQQAMPDGGSMEISIENIVLTRGRSLGMSMPLKKGNYIRIAVEDHGRGIPAEHLARIFDPFFTTKPKGSGLGLATSFSIARRHGGHLSVESEVGCGSTFYLYLPASLEIAASRQEKNEQIKPAGKVRILVMDDEEEVREVTGRMLKHIGFQDIDFAADGAEAIKLYKAAMESGNPFTVVILDLTIPGGLGGRETVNKLLRMDPAVRAVVTSGYVNESSMAEYRGYGFSGMVAKPYTFDKLRQVLFEQTGRRRSTDK